MALRHWQSACITKALRQYETGNKHFFCQATPAAGKTRMSAELAKKMLATQMIELVICFAPSKEVVDGFCTTFKLVTGRQFDGRIGAAGAAFTYQAMDYLSDDFWLLFRNYRVLAVFDEIHHCASHITGESNVWGQTIVQRIQNVATFTMALSGTPWRTDDLGIALAKYSNPEGNLVCDYRYGLADAVRDFVCRSPRIVTIDNDDVHLSVSSQKQVKTTRFRSINALLGSADIGYQDLLSNEHAMGHLLEIANRKLNEIRRHVTDAAGLVVASTIEHAQQVSQVLRLLGESASVVTSESDDARRCIREFREGSSRWIIAVGMIAEGTDIPRIQVCCHLSRIRTELHFRQVLGRALRRRGNLDSEAWMYMFAEAKLSLFADRVSSDLPEDLAVLSSIVPRHVDGEHWNISGSVNESILNEPVTSKDLDQDLTVGLGVSDTRHFFHQLDFSERFRHQLLAIF
ncbi:MAG: DEAD/DEAH box helicase family protein [Pseudohongiella sp.]|nr:DEAD/DEAH box helicase family protein [Pseudohongiella sp.]